MNSHHPRRRRPLGGHRPSRRTLPALLLVAACLVGPARANGPDLAPYLAAVQSSPASPEAHKRLGNALIDAGRYEEAVRQFREAVRLDPRYAKGYHNMGRALAYEGDDAGALAAYRKAVALQPYYPIVYYDMGQTYAGQGRPEQALAAYGKAARQLPTDARAFDGMGETLSGLGRHAEALTAFEKSLALGPDNMARVTPVAWEFYALGQKAMAWKLIRRAAELAPLCPVTHCTMARFHAQEGDWAGAVEEYRLSLESFPDFPQGRVEYGVALWHAGRKGDARAEWTTVARGTDEAAAQEARSALSRFH